MDIQKLKDHLENTPLEQLKKEWKEVEEFTAGPAAEELIKSWSQDGMIRDENIRKYTKMRRFKKIRSVSHGGGVSIFVKKGFYSCFGNMPCIPLLKSQ